MTDFLNAKVGNAKRKLKVKDISKKTVKLKNGKTSEKIVFSTIEEGTGRTFEISDSYINDPDEGTAIKGLWYNSHNQGKINQASALAKVLQYYNAEVLKDLIGQNVVAYPDSNNYLVLTACPVD